jgi:hypothetical protein
MRIFGLTVGRNEAARYLIPMLMHSLDIFDDVYFYDDQSTDETAVIVSELNCSGRIRADHIPSFVESEGDFRAAAWEAFEEDLSPRPGDWVQVIDCDESLVSEYGAQPSDVRATMEKVITAASGHVGVMETIPEVWGFDEDGCPLIRVDGLWNTIHAPRLFPYRPNGQYYRGAHFGVPAVPNYVMGGPWFGTDLIQLMHYGYAELDDQVTKYGRYSGQTGHSNQHVESIAQPGVFDRWPGAYNPYMRAAWARD